MTTAGGAYGKLAAVRGAGLQALDLTTKVQRVAGGADIGAAAKTMSARLLQIEGLMTQLERIGGQDTYYYPGMLDSQLLDLYYEITGAERRLTQAPSSAGPICNRSPQTCSAVPIPH